MDSLAPESNRIFMVIGFGLKSPVHNLPFRIRAKSDLSFNIDIVSCTFMASRLPVLILKHI